MPLSEQRAKELAELEPPKSIDRIVRFVEDLGLALMGSGDETQADAVAPESAEAPTQRREVPKKHAAKRTILGSLTAAKFRTLIQRHAVSPVEVIDFALWLGRWNRKRTEVETIRLPDQVFIPPASPLGPEPGVEPLTPIWSRRRARSVAPATLEWDESGEATEAVRRPARKKAPASTAMETDFEPDIEAERGSWVAASKPTFARKAPAEPTEPDRAPELAEGREPAPNDPRVAVRTASRGVWTANVGMGGLVAGMLVSQRASLAAATMGPGVAGGAMMPGAVGPSGMLLPPPEVAVSAVPLQPTALPPLFTHGSTGLQTLDGSLVRASSANAMVSPQVLDASSGVAGGVPVPVPQGGGPIIGYLPGGGVISAPISAVAAARAQSTLSGGTLVHETVGGPSSYIGPARAPGAVLTPEMGQVTIIAPPIRVASEQMEQKGGAVSLKPQDLFRSGKPLDAATWAELSRTLPPGSQILYPAAPQGSVEGRAVNLQLSRPLLGALLEQGYGPGASMYAGAISSLAASSLTSAPPASPNVPAAIVPGKRPMGEPAGLFAPTPEAPEGALATSGGAAASRGTPLDFLGVPVRMAPSLSGRSELKQEVELQKAAAPEAKGAPLRPHQFQPLRDKLFGSSMGIEAEPDRAEWRKAAPSIGLKGDRPEEILSPRAMVKPPTASEPLPQLHGDDASSVGPVGGDLTQRTATIPSQALARQPFPSEGADAETPPPSRISLAPGALGSMPPPTRNVVPTSEAVPPTTPELGAEVRGESPQPSPPASGTGLSLASSFMGAPQPSISEGSVPVGLPIFGGRSRPPLSLPTRKAAPIPASAVAPTPTLPAAAKADPPGRAPARSPWSLPPKPTTGPRSMPTEPPFGSDADSTLPAVQSPRRPALETPLSTPTPGAVSAPTPALPDLTPQPATRVGTSISNVRQPDRLLPNLSELQKPNQPPTTLAIQRSEARASTRTGGATQARRQSQGEPQQQGAQGADVNALANEVWMLLKRRIDQEKDRFGRR